MPYFIVVFLIFVFFISNVCKVNVYSKTIDPSPLKFEQARRLAINRLEYCTSNRECRQKNFNDILSGWWNLGTFSQNYKTSIKIMFSSAIKNGILSRLKDSNLCALQGHERAAGAAGRLGRRALLHTRWHGHYAQTRYALLPRVCRGSEGRRPLRRRGDATVGWGWRE